MNTTLLLQQILNGLAIGGVYAIFALGYTLVFSILRIINFAHGAVFTLGAYFTYLLTGSAINTNGVLYGLFNRLFGQPALPISMPFALAMVLGAALAGLTSVLIERVAFRPLRRRGADPLLTLVSSLGVAIALVNIIQYLFGAEIYTFPANPFGAMPAAINFGVPGRPIPVRTVQIIIFGVSMVIVAGLTLLINATRTGKALLAVAEDGVTASLLGINTARLIVLTFFLSGFLGGIAGTLVGLSVSIAGPYFGIAFGLKGLAVIVLGGLGDIPGAVVGGFVIGLAEAFVPAQYVAYKDAVAFALLFLMLLARPQGLLGRALVQKV
ncbi:flagellar biosynthesis protein FlgM [Kouleothrix aurantiaca]|uniref:Flagellar biosynthesis protein FlgM n=1 Tax=Kouleothrix aurantiaca TaxID=186479 RepID=A0A0N8PRB2_9CHLR|nr:flagellar biosynthesis protein FlgM [Kouleothrix aurantiaca]